MVIPDFSGDYLKWDTVVDGDIYEVIDEGKSEYSEQLKKNVFNMHVKNSVKTWTWTPNNESGKAMQKEFGADTKDWIGKKFQAFNIGNTLKIKPLKV